MGEIEIYRKYERCSGDGTVEAHGQNPITCPDCSGSGKMLFADSTNLDTKLDALDAHLDTIDTHLDTIETKIDAL